MARLPDEEIERLKTEISLERLIEASGVELAKQGSDLVGRCPFHEDRTPSLVVSPDKNLWHCLGACDSGGSVIDWVMAAEGVSFRHAVELLRDGVAPTAPATGKPPQRSTTRRLEAPIEASGSDPELLERVTGFYHRTLKESPETLDYLNRRKIHHPEAIEHFRLGHSNRTLGYRLPERNRKAGAELRGRLQKLGVLRASGHEHLAGSLVVPLFDAQGRVVQLYGRKLRSDLRPGTPLHLYLPTERRGILNAGALQASEELVLCEAAIDALTFWAQGIRNVTATFGAGGLTEELTDALAGHEIERVLLAFDADAAGDKMAAKAAETLIARGIECFRVQLPPGSDANEVACSADDPLDALAEALRGAAWMGSGPAPKLRAASAPLVSEAPRQRGSEEEEAEGAADAADEPEPLADPSTPSPAATAAQAAPKTADPPPASPLPPAPTDPQITTTKQGDEATLELGSRRWRIRGLGKVSSFDLLRLNVLVSQEDSRGEPRFWVDTLDLYSARARQAFCKGAAEELGAGEQEIRRELGRVLLACENLAEERVAESQKPKTPEITLTDEERAAALELLRDPNLTERIAADFERSGIVGEADNALLAYLAATSRKLPRPLAAIVQSASAAGKSALIEATLAMIPPEQRVAFSAMTGQSLFYMGESDLQGKVLAIAEEEGATNAAYALKLLQSEGELSIASTGKDAATGRLQTHTYTVRGPVAILLTTTSTDLDPELLNRCLVLSVSEERSQTEAIHAAQRSRQTLAGQLAGTEREQLLALHQNAQRLIEPLLVANPLAERLSFPAARTRSRRDHDKYLTLISAIALLHQHQRPKRSTTHRGRQVTFIEATTADVELANHLASVALGRSLDELPPATRRVLSEIDSYLTARARREGTKRERIRFSRRELREATGSGDTQLKVHLARLTDLELLAAHRTAAGRYCYEPLFESAEGELRLAGLTDPAAFSYDEPQSPSEADRSGPGRPSVGGRSGAGRSASEQANGAAQSGNEPPHDPETPERTAPGADDRRVVVAAAPKAQAR